MDAGHAAIHVALQQKYKKIESGCAYLFYSAINAINAINQRMSSIEADTTGILITPIAKVIKSKTAGTPDSRRDYNEQCDRFSKGQPMCWDDDKNNNTKVGDIFGFCKQPECVELHRVEAVHDPSHRLPSWSNNVGQSGRNVLMLSCTLCVVPWCDWVKFGWHASGPLLGTQRVANEQSRVQMIQYINAVFRNGTEV